MSLQTISCENNSFTGEITIECEWTHESIGDTTSVLLKKRVGTSGAWKQIKEISVAAGDDMTFRYVDVETISGVTYYYRACVMAGGTQTEYCDGNVVCSFSGIMIADSTGSWFTNFGTSDGDMKFDVKKKRSVQYVTTLNGLYPHVVSSAETNYCSGTVTALFMPLDSNCNEPIASGTTQFRDAFLEFLCNGNRKLLKSGDGRAYIVSVDGEPSENFSPFGVLSTITFNWTQVGAIEKPIYEHNTSVWTEVI